MVDRRHPFRKMTLAWCIATAAAFIMVAAPGSARAQNNPSGDAAPLRIALLLPDRLPAGFAPAVREGAAQAAAELTVDLVVQDGALRLADAAGQIATASSAAVAGVIMAAAEPDQLAAGLAAMADSGLPVITVGSGLDVARAAGASLHIGPDDFSVGRAAGDRMRDSGAQDATCIKSPQFTVSEDVRCMGLGVAMERPVSILVLPDPGDDLAATAERLLDGRGSDHAIVFAGANPLAATIADRAGSASETDKPAIAAVNPDRAFLNVLREAARGFAIDTQPRLQGYLAVAVLARAVRTGDLPVSDILTGPRIIAAGSVRAAAMPVPVARPSARNGRNNTDE